jgi:glutamate--cysteine ligase
VADVEQFVGQSYVQAASLGRVGIELEWIVVAANDPLEPVAHDTVRSIAGAVGPLPGGSRITFEPGGQIELSSPPHAGISAACESIDTDLRLVRSGLETAGIEMVGIGLDPRRPSALVIGDPRYQAMERYFSTEGGAGGQMMGSTAAIQVNLDLGSETRRLSRWRLVHALGPVLTAAFANSPFTAGTPNGFRSGRAAVWEGIDRSRTAPVDATGNDPAGAWVRYALAARVMLVRVTERRFEPVGAHLPFLQWMKEGHELGYPTLDDFVYHLTTLFPPVRPRGWLELRMIDALPDPWWRVAVAVTAALVEDEEAAGAATRATREVGRLWRSAARGGLAHPRLALSARECFEAALSALPRLGGDGDTIADTAAYFDRFVARGRCPADDLLDGWRTDGRLFPGSLPLEGVCS